MLFKLFVFASTLISIITLISGEIVSFQNCEDSDESICEVKEVRVEPCKEAKSKKACKVTSGTNATIEFDYVAHFDTDKAVSQVYSASFVDLPLLGMDRDGCKFTECPLKSGEIRTYKNTLFMAPAFPALSYNVKWRIWDAKNDKSGCCFTFKIKLVR